MRRPLSAEVNHLSSSNLQVAQSLALRNNTHANTVLVCAPDYFEVRDEKNPFMQGNVGTVVLTRALQQWKTMVDSFTACGVTVERLKPLANCEDMVFTANPSFNGISNEGRKICVPARMAFPSRVPEVVAHRDWFSARGYQIVEMPNEIKRFEGGGDTVWHPSGKLLFAAEGARTERAAHSVLADIFGVDVVSLQLADRRFYHLDTAFCAVSERTALIYAGAFNDAGLRAIHEAFPDVIDVPQGEAIGQMACNATAFFGTDVVLQEGATQTIQALEERGLRVHQVETDEFRKSGGSVFCMKNHIYS